MCPPATDQTQRFPQRWCILAPSRSEKLALTRSKKRYASSVAMISLLREPWRLGIFEKLARSSQSSRQVIRSDLKTTASSGGSQLERLPAELLHMTIDNLDMRKEDVLALALASRTLWVQLLDRIHSDYIKEASPWADTPLICSGTYLRSLPPALLDLLPDQKDAEETWPAGLPTLAILRPVMYPARRWNWSALSTFSDVSATDATQRWVNTLAHHIDCAAYPDHTANELRRDLERATLPADEARDCAGDWILRNLDLKELVALKVLRTKEPEKVFYTHVKGNIGLSVEKALLLRICWSDVGSLLRGRDNVDGLAKSGFWAGHRFDIIPKGETLEGWTDVSSEMLAEAEALGIADAALIAPILLDNQQNQ